MKYDDKYKIVLIDFNLAETLDNSNSQRAKEKIKKDFEFYNLLNSKFQKSYRKNDLINKIESYGVK